DSRAGAEVPAASVTRHAANRRADLRRRVFVGRPWHGVDSDTGRDGGTCAAAVLLRSAPGGTLPLGPARRGPGAPTGAARVPVDDRGVGRGPAGRCPGLRR